MTALSVRAGHDGEVSWQGIALLLLPYTLAPRMLILPNVTQPDTLLVE